MPNPADCPLCGSKGNFEPHADRNDYTCLRCGKYSLTGTAETMLQERPLLNRGTISGWIRRQNSMGITPTIDSDAVPRLAILAKPPLQERVEQYLLAAGAKSQRLDELFNPGADDLVGISYSDDVQELAVIVQYVESQGLVTELVAPGNANRRLTPKGIIAADELRTRRAASTQAFVAMAFTDEMNPVYIEGIEPAIHRAGFSPMIIRNKEHANKIDDEIIAEIRRSAFLVADFTHHRQNVYFETGFTIGLARQVVWTCRKDHIKDLHFDIRQYNCIDWENSPELAARLQRRIEAMFGRGPLAL